MSELIAGGLALVGIWIGSLLTRQNQHRTWLLEKRAEAFPEYLQSMEKCLLYVSEILENWDDSLETKIKMTELYSPVSYQVNIIKMYISSETRDEFNQLTKEIWGYYSGLSKKENNKSPIYKRVERIQEIFEDNFKEPKFIFGKIFELFERKKLNWLIRR